MIDKNNFTLQDRNIFEASLVDAAQKALRLLQQNALGIFVRYPFLDEECPEASDVDLLAIWEKPEEFPERLAVETSTGRVFVDVLWIPVAEMLDPIRAASFKILPHLLLESKTMWIRSNSVTPLFQNIKENIYRKPVWEQRINNQISFGDAALEESKKNLDFPPAVLFFLQTAHSYYIMALADCLKHSTMSLLTKPVVKLRQIDTETGCNMTQHLSINLHLGLEPSTSIAALRAVYDKVAARCAGRKLQGVNMRTRGHYMYTISPLEFEYRESVAKTLTANNDFADANFYVRFWAYALSRCPVVLEDARLGRKPSFYVPYNTFKISINYACPEILDDMKTILSKHITSSQAEDSIDCTTNFRQLIIEQIQAKGINIKKKKESAASNEID